MPWKNEQVSEEETAKIIRLAQESLSLEGDFVEMGCYKGDTSLLLAEVLRDYNRGAVVDNSVDKAVENSWKNGEKGVEINKSRVGRKRLWIYDSFEGLPEKGRVDESVLGMDFRKGELYVTKREVKNRFLKAGLPVPVIKKAWFSELGPDDMPERIAFAFLDGDLYESIRDSLRLVGPRMASGGVIAIHDYTNPALPGVGKAVEEWGMRGDVFASMAIIRIN